MIPEKVAYEIVTRPAAKRAVRTSSLPLDEIQATVTNGCAVQIPCARTEWARVENRVRAAMYYRGYNCSIQWNDAKTHLVVWVTSRSKSGRGGNDA